MTYWYVIERRGMYEERTDIPYSSSNLAIYVEGLDIVISSHYIYLYVDMLNAIVQVQLPEKYINKTCGLCGDFNGFEYYDEGFNTDDPDSINAILDEFMIDIPGEYCVHSSAPLKPICNYVNDTCKQILQSAALANCTEHFNMLPYLEMCEMDSCNCNTSDSLVLACICSTLSEFSKQCAHAKLYTGNWRSPEVCGNLTVFMPTSFYAVVKADFGLQLELQLTPIMQAYIYVERSYFGLTCGLCGNFNDKQADDYTLPNGLTMQDLSTFTYAWRSEQTCPNVPTIVIDPCSIYIQKEAYASMWCSKINSEKIFATCRELVDPAIYYQLLSALHAENSVWYVLSYRPEERGFHVDLKSAMDEMCTNCLYDTCLCKHSEDCMCALFSSFVRACTEHGIIIDDWREVICTRYIQNCDAPMVYRETVHTCQPTCKSLGEPDKSCTVDFVDIDGCVYCTLPMVYFNCSEEPPGSQGIECLKSCQNLDVDCGSTILLSDGDVQIISEGTEMDSQFQLMNNSLFLSINFTNGLVMIWDKKTALTVKIPVTFQHKVCGMCGNYDGNSNNDFTTRSQLSVEDVMEFGNSWKLPPTCPDADSMIEPCDINHHRKSWAQKQCGIMLGPTFKPCHSEVDPTGYYEACVKDSCACDEGGDCECYCTAIAMYALQCLSHCICIEWRTPGRCPVFCDYYNEEGKCEWHYKACGANCMQTCRNPSGNCSTEPVKIEGCYPRCPEDTPYYEETTMKCVSQCGCYDHMGHYYMIGDKIVSCNNCEVW
ncbi:mucin-5B-like [Eleutherodactylus coqui]|uniref:mucin-5B-like n=1 Tax=Eleutherodactylus coqui TaxID=57060 RepID=UPI0034628F59